MTKITESLQPYLGDDGEHVVFSTRQHPIVIFGAVIKIVIDLALMGLALWLITKIGFLDSGDPRKYSQIIIVVAAIIYALLQVWRLLIWNSERLVISTHKVLHVHGVISRDIASTPLVKVDELTVRQSVLGRILGYGHLDVENAGGDREPLHGLSAVPKPGEVYRLITDSARRERMIEGGARVDQYEPTPAKADAKTPEEIAAEKEAAEQRLKDVGSTGDDAAE